jgi:chromosome partitioning protein
MRFLDSLGIPIIAVLRDSQNYVHAAESGIGVCDLPPHKIRKDIEELERIVRWLDAWEERRRDPSEKRRIAQAANVAVFRKPGLGSA